MNEPHATPPDDSYLTRYRPWLKLLADMQVESRFQAKFDASDLVQQTLVEAWKGAERFRGTSEPERMAWLRGILANVLAHEERRWRGTQKRDLAREVSIERSLAESSQQIGLVLPAGDATPSAQAIQNEVELRLAEALETLPADMRQVILLRNIQGLPHDQIAERMGRTTNAVRMLWVRALKALRVELAGDEI